MQARSNYNMEHTKRVLADWEMKLACQVCGKLPEQPHLLRCTHSFCKNCIIAESKCPKCGFYVTPKDIVPNLMLSNLLNFMKASSVLAIRYQPTTSKKKKAKILSKPIIQSILPKEKCSDNKNNPNGNKKDLSSELSRNDETIAQELKTPARKKKRRSGQKKNSDEESNEKAQKNYAQPLTLYSAKKSQFPNKINSRGETKLQIASRQGKLSTVQLLLEEGAEPNVKDYANWTPLCDAVNNGHLEVARTLLASGACANTPAQHNTTALVEAVLRHDAEMVRLLVQHGADPDQRTALDNTALSLADDEIKAIILEAKGVPIQPHVQVTLTPKTVLIGELPQKDLDKVKELCKRFNLTLTTVFTPDTTHVLVAGEEGRGTAGDQEALIGLAAGCCVLSAGWAAACLREGSLLPAEGYEPAGTPDYPDTGAFTRSRINREKLLPQLFDGAHISLAHTQRWPPGLQAETEALARAAGAQFQPREADAERVPHDERTIMFHAPRDSPLAIVSHLVLYRPAEREPELKYNMPHIKSLPLSWFMECLENFQIRFDAQKYF